MNNIFGIVGMCGSGKSVLTEYLVEIGWTKIYFGGVTINELKKRNLEINEHNERKIREELREHYGLAAYAIKLESSIREAVEHNNVIIDGLYTWQEYLYLKKVFGESFKVIAVVVDKEIRYKRLKQRDVRPLSKEEALGRDYSEIENLEKGGPIAIADYYLLNNDDRASFYGQIETLLNNI